MVHELNDLWVFLENYGSFETDIKNSGHKSILHLRNLEFAGIYVDPFHHAFICHSHLIRKLRRNTTTKRYLSQFLHGFIRLVLSYVW